MRLHRLDITAFGPYPRHEVVDFDALGSDGLFLLHGDTGAGKTTLLDAVAFALFGTVPGARGQVKRLRCDYADAATRTEVVLELTVQRHRLRVARSPEYERPKKRGDGVTLQPAKASLTWLGVPPSGHAPDGLTRIDEVGRTVQGLLGMSAEQFFQVVLLPQGEFARFLRADTAEREQLLERLFGTRRFADVERWFRDRRQDQGRVLEGARQVVRDLVSRVAQAAGEEPPEQDDPAGEPWLADIERRLTDAAALAADKERAARAERERAEGDLAERRALAERVRRVRTAVAELNELAEHAEQRRAWRDEIDAARQAVPVVAADDAARRLADELRQAERAADEAAKALLANGVPVGPASDGALDGPGRLDGPGGPDVRRLAAAEAVELRAAAAALREEAGALNQLVADAEQQRLDTERLAELARTAERAAERLAELDNRLAALPVRARRTRDELDLAVAASARLDGVLARRDELDAASAAAGRLPEVRAAAEEALAASQRAVDAHQKAREDLLDLRQRRLDGMAAELAGGLVDGLPCPVCGAAEHPAPAHAVTEPVAEADERAAERAEHDALQRRQLAAERVHAAERDLAALHERLAGRTAAELADALREAHAEYERTADLAARADDLRAELAALDTELASAEEQRTRTRSERDDAVATRTTLADLVAERARRLDHARGPHPDVVTRRQYLLDRTTHLDRLADARSAVADLRRRTADQQAAAAAEAIAAGFADLAEALGAAREQAVVDKLDAQLNDADGRERAARRTLSEIDLAGLDPDTDVDLADAQRGATEARAAAEAAVAALAAARRRETDVAALGVRLRAAWAELAPAEAAFAELAALTDVVNGRGQNARKMSLRSYVLASRLAEVALAATARLQRMSQGRYSFVYSDGPGSHGTRSGLGLDVLDDYSGRVRPAKTLSGGESFLASLSLALGLADVVAAETGGALLDTLFVDEGFGTLDAETLDVVMNGLDELRAGGRVVGLVSHVEELRQRIPVQLRITKSRTGSSLHFTGGR